MIAQCTKSRVGAPAPNLGMKQEVCSPSTQTWRKQEDEKFQVILSYKLKKLKTSLGYRTAFLKKTYTCTE